MPSIVDQFGRPFQKKAAKPLSDMVHIRRTEPLSGSTTLSVEALASTLRLADEGDIEAYIELASEMEERDLHYFSQLQTRRLALTGKTVQAQPRDSSPKAKEIADAFQETVIDDEAFPGLMSDLLDALGKSFSLVQPIWDTSTTPWGFSEYAHVPAESLTYWIEDNTHNRQFTDNDLHVWLADGGKKRITDLPGLYLLHKPKIRTGITIRGGFARIAARTFLLKNYSLKDWVAFCEVYGMPVRYATYDPETITEEEKLTIAMALANLGHDASAMIPRTVELQILGEAARTGSGDTFEKLIKYLDEQQSKAILGQTMTSDDGSSLAQASIHNEVRIDILKADATAMQLTLRHLCKAWTAVNYGDDAPRPRIGIAVEPPADLESFTKAVLPWVQAGLQVSRAWVLDRLDAPEPEDEADQIELVVPELPPGPGDEENEPATGKALHSLTGALTGWDELLQPHVDELEQLAKEADGYEAFLKALELKPSAPLIKRLAKEAMAARRDP